MINLIKWRNDGIQEQFAYYVNSVKGQISFEDQGVLNAVLKKEMFVLPFKYNVMTIYYDMGYDGASVIRGASNFYKKKEINEACKTPSIVHFTNSFASNRPWVENCQHPFSKKWLYYRAQTPWKNAPLYKDKKSMYRMVNRWVFNKLPHGLGLKYIAFVITTIRPLAEKLNKFCRLKLA